MNAQNTGSSARVARSVKIGLAAIVMVWITGPLTVPMVNTLRLEFSAEELLFVRSWFGIAVSLALVGNKVWSSDWRIKLAGLIIGLSSITFYRALQAWKINPVMVVLAFLPVVNVTIAVIEGRRISRPVITYMLFLFGGIIVALDPWNDPINLKGLMLSIACIVLGGIGFELWGRAPKVSTVSEKCFWMAFPLVFMTSGIILFTQLPVDSVKYCNVRAIGLLAFLGFVNGVVYMYATIIPFSSVGKLDTTVTCILLQVTTPCTFIGAQYFAGETLSWLQWGGVAVAIGSATRLSLWLAKQSKENSS